MRKVFFSLYKAGYLIVAVGLLAGLSLVSSASAKTVRDNEGGNKVQICHRTSSATNPYTINQVSINATGNGTGVGDHFMNHTGPVAYTQAIAEQLKDEHQDWGDIIPPNAGSPNGLNWSVVGQAVYENGCNPVTVVTPVRPVATTPTCEVPTMVVTPAATTGVTWVPAAATTLQPGQAVTYTASAAKGYVILPDGSVSWTFTNTFDPESCVTEEPAEIAYTIVCKADGTILVTLTNNDETSGQITVNDEVISVAGNTKATRTFANNTKVTIVADRETVHSDVISCGGRGGEEVTPTTPSNPVTPQTVVTGTVQAPAAKPVATALPSTAGSPLALVSVLVTAGAVVLTLLSAVAPRLRSNS